MIPIPPMIDALVDGPIVDLTAVSDALVEASPHSSRFDLESFASVAARLPRGLVYADAIWLIAEPLPGLSPLAPGSAWYAIDRNLAVVLPPGRAALVRMVADLGRYALAAWHIRERMEDSSELIEALADPSLSTEMSTKLALVLDASPAFVAGLDAGAPGLRRDLATMADMPFSPVVHVHASLRPQQWLDKGHAIADRLLAEIPDGPVRLVVSDGRWVTEHLSPYVRDLGHALSAWGAQNAADLTTSGLAAALAEPRAAPDLDLAALVVPDLFAVHPDLLPERRDAERSAGLKLYDDGATAWGWADLSTLDGADPSVLPDEPAGTFVVIAGGAHETLGRAVADLLAAREITGIACVFGTVAPTADVVVPRAIITDDDGFALARGPRMADRAAAMGIACESLAAARADGLLGAPTILVEILRRVRRSRVLGRGIDASQAVVVLHAAPGSATAPALETRRSRLDAARLALASVCDARVPDAGGPARSGKPPKSVRFRV